MSSDEGRGPEAQRTLCAGRVHLLDDQLRPALKRWAASEKWINAQRGSDASKACVAVAKPLYESTEMTLGTVSTGFKSFFCEVEPWITHRRCMQMVKAKYSK